MRKNKIILDILTLKEYFVLCIPNSGSCLGFVQWTKGSEL